MASPLHKFGANNFTWEASWIVVWSPPREKTLAACGLEEPWNSQELLIESVGPVSLFCVLYHIVPICYFSVVLKYITYALTHARRNIHLWTILYIIVS